MRECVLLIRRNTFIFRNDYDVDEDNDNLFLNINQLDALNFIISFFQASTCFEHMCSSSGGQNYCHVLILIELYFNNFNYFSNFKP